MTLKERQEAETDAETLYSYTLKRSDGAVWRWPDGSDDRPQCWMIPAPLEHTMPENF